MTAVYAEEGRSISASHATGDHRTDRPRVRVTSEGLSVGRSLAESAFLVNPAPGAYIPAPAARSVRSAGANREFVIRRHGA